MHCKNCKEDIEFNPRFCSNCGQEVIVALDSKYFNTILKEGISFDRGFSFNVKNLFLKGGNSVNQFISGHTKPFQNPILFFITTMGILILIMSLTEGLISGTFFQFLENGEKTPVKFETRGPDSKQVRWLYLVITTLIIPLFSLVFYMLKDRKKQPYVQSVIVTVFLLSALNLIQSFVILFNRTVFHFLSKVIGYYDSDTVGLFVSALIITPYLWYFLYTYFNRSKLIKTAAIFVVIAIITLAILYIGESTAVIQQN